MSVVSVEGKNVSVSVVLLKRTIVLHQRQMGGKLPLHHWSQSGEDCQWDGCRRERELDSQGCIELKGSRGL